MTEPAEVYDDELDFGEWLDSIRDEPQEDRFDGGESEQLVIDEDA